MSQLKSQAAQNGTTLFNVLLAGVGMLLARYGNDDGVCVVTPVANRDLMPGLLHSVGYFVNTLVVFMAAQTTSTFAELIQQAKNAMSSALKHAHVPYQQVVSVALPRNTAPQVGRQCLAPVLCSRISASTSFLFITLS